MTAGQTIAERRRKLGMTQMELAERTGYTSKTSISKIEAGLVDLSSEKIRLFSEVLGLPVEAFFPSTLSKKARTATFSIPIVPQRLSAGNLDIKRVDILDGMARGCDRMTLAAVEVRGDSMVGENIEDGDLVVFSQGMVGHEGIYVVACASEVMVKRLAFDMVGGKVSIISANPNYPPQTMDASDVAILGKVVGWIHYER